MEALTVHSVASAVRGAVWPRPSAQVLTGVSIDSRTIAPGQMFAALRGPNFDGHDFIADAAAKGAAAVLLENNSLDASKEALAAAAIPAIAVADVQAALQALATWRRSQFQGPVIAITGSNGKTTTKDMAAAIVSERWKTHATPGNFNNELGLPLTLLGLTADHEALVVEMGMRGPKEIAALARIARPTVGVVTNVGPVHLERLGSMAAIIDAKSELVEGLTAEGVAVLNANDERVLAMRHRTRARALTFGFDRGADVWADAIEAQGIDSVQFRLHWSGDSIMVRIPVPGRHNVANALAAAAAAFACGASLDDVAQGMGNLKLSSMRMQIERLERGVTIINDAYNAAPASMRAALETLGDVPANRKLAVLGDMLELGEVAIAEHEAIGQECARLGLDRLVTVGELGRVIASAAALAGLRKERIAVCASAQEAAEDLLSHLKPGDAVLIKASRGLQLENVVATIKAALADSAKAEGGGAR